MIQPLNSIVLFLLLVPNKGTSHDILHEWRLQRRQELRREQIKHNLEDSAKQMTNTDVS